MNRKFNFLSYLVLFSFLTLVLSPIGYLYAQENTNTDVLQTEDLVSWEQCPYDFEFDISEGYNKVILQHIGSDGAFNKFGGWKAWVEVNGNRIYEWRDFKSETGSEWYDFTTGEHVFDKDLDSDSTDITDFVTDGSNTLTYFHYNEGPGSGIYIEVEYAANKEVSENGDAIASQDNGQVSGDQDTYDIDIEGSSEPSSSEGESPEKDTEAYSSEQLILDEQLDLKESLEDRNEGISVEETEKLVFNFKSLYIDMDNPSYVFGRDIPGLSEDSLKEYNRSDLYSSFLGPGQYIQPSDSWEDIARLALVESKVHYNYAQRIGYFKSLYNILSVFYIIQSFRESLTEIPGQFNKLKSFKSASDIVKNADTFISLTSNLSGIYETVVAVDKEGARELGFPELDSKVMFVIGAISSGGWSVLGDISKATFIDNAQYSINYEIKKALLNTSLAYHAQKIHELALKDKFSAKEIEDFYFHARRIAVLKQIDTLLNIEDSVSLWQENPDLVTRAFDFLNIIDKESALEQDIDLYNQILSNYESAESYLINDMGTLGLDF